MPNRLNVGARKLMHYRSSVGCKQGVGRREVLVLVMREGSAMRSEVMLQHCFSAPKFGKYLVETKNAQMSRSSEAK